MPSLTESCTEPERVAENDPRIRILDNLDIRSSGDLSFSKLDTSLCSLLAYWSPEFYVKSSKFSDSLLIVVSKQADVRTRIKDIFIRHRGPSPTYISQKYYHEVKACQNILLQT